MLKGIQTRLHNLGADPKSKVTHTLPKIMVLECNQRFWAKAKDGNEKVELAHVALVREDASSIAKLLG